MARLPDRPALRARPGPGRLACLLLGALAGILGPAPAPARTPSWEETLERVSRAVVALRVSAPRSFDTERASFSTATGFVVDAERGLILTNRHVVQPGPVVADAVFLNHEEVELRAVYRDPVHDFGLFAYDPAEVRFMEPGALRLAPEKARVGTEIRIVGNDAGEKLSILAGTLARLDREAPEYGRGRYHDFNTFYLQAASGSTAGSSGSPVVDRHGDVVGLVAGGNALASSNFFLPLDRVGRALDRLREGRKPPRGTLQTVLRYRSYDELERLGLRPETEALLREARPQDVGMLVVAEVLPEGPAHGRLLVGDIVVRVGSELVTRFVPLEALLDAHVGETLRLEVERRGESIEVEVPVADLHAVTPAEYLEVGGAVAHELSYQQARNYGVPQRGVYLAASGYVFSRAGIRPASVIVSVDGESVANLDEFEARVASFPDGERVSVGYFHLSDPRNEALALARIDRSWFHMQRCARDDADGTWPCRASPEPPPPGAREPVTTSFPAGGNRIERALAPSLVMVEFDVPYRLDGIHGVHFRGTGLVVDAERGLVVVDRETIPVALGDARITVAASVEVPAEVVYLHPSHNLAVVRYDPALLGDTRLRSAKLRDEALRPGDEIWLVGLTSRDSLISRQTRVSRVEAPRLPLPDPPRFRETNLELIGVADETGTVGGVLADDQGRVVALWAAFSLQSGAKLSSFFAGIASGRLLEIVEPLREGRSVGWRDLGVEFEQITLAEARARGLPGDAARRFEAAESRRVLAVRRLSAGTEAWLRLRAGDLLASVDGRPALSFAGVERASQTEQMEIEIARNGEMHRFELATAPRDGRGRSRCVQWAGAVLQEQHPALARQRGIVPRGVYVAWFWYGSPANRFGLGATRRIIEVDGRPTHDLEAFLDAVRDHEDGEAVRVRTLELEGKVEVVTLELDLRYWPTEEIRRTENGWRRERL